MLITAELVMKKKPCSDWPMERLQSFYGEGKTLIEVLDSEDVSCSDRIWTAIKFITDKQNRKFAIWCARQCAPKIAEITAYVDMIEKFYNGEATQDELEAAYCEAYWAAGGAAYCEAYWAADCAAEKIKMLQKQIAKLKEIIQAE